MSLRPLRVLKILSESEVFGGLLYGLEYALKCRDTGSIPDWETKNLSCHRATKPAHHRVCALQQLKPACSGVRAWQWQIAHEEMKILPAATETQCSQISKFKNKTIFSYYHDIIYLFHNVDICCKNGKAMVAKTTGTSVQIKVVIPSCTSGHSLLSTHSL